MARELEMDKKQGIEQLFASGMPKRQIARTLGIDRKSVDRRVARLKSKGATSAGAPTGEAPTGSEVSKGARAPTGSVADERVLSSPLNERLKTESSRSQCVRFHDWIVAKIEQGLTAQRIYQDLVADYDFSAK